MIEVGTRQEYVDAVVEDYLRSDRKELMRQIAHCWQRIDRLNQQNQKLKEQCQKS